MASDWLVIFLVLSIVLVALSALFSGIETALFSLNPLQIRRLRKRNPGLATALDKLMKNPRRLISAILLADALVNLPLMTICLFLMRNLAPTIEVFWLEVIAIFTLIVLFCDLAPKLFALARPHRAALIGVKVFRWIAPLLNPVCKRLQNFSEKIADALTPAKFQQRHFLSEEELETLARWSVKEGALGYDESEMILEIIKLGDKTVKDCMTPRTDMFAIPDDLANGEVIAQLKQKRFHHVPVYGETPDDIIGVLDVKRFLFDSPAHYTESLTPPAFIAETMKAFDLLRNFLRHPQSLAIIVDEFGGTEGIVTYSDIIETIISDAVPLAENGTDIEPLGGGRFLANGRTRLDDLSEVLETPIEAEGIDTVGGLVFNRLGGLSKEHATVETSGFRFTIRRTSRKRIQEVLIEKMTEKEVAE